MIKRLAHVCFKTDQMNQLVDFYQNTLGMPVKFTFKLEDGTIFGYYFDLGETTFLEIFDKVGSAKQWGGSTEPLNENAGTYYQHFCLQIENLEAYCQMLKDKGVTVTDIKVGLDHSRQAWIKDPDGNSIELMEYTSDSWQLK